MTSLQLKSNYKCQDTISSIYTGGSIQYTSQGILYTNYTDGIVVSEYDQQKDDDDHEHDHTMEEIKHHTTTKTIAQVESDTISCFMTTLSHLIVCHTSTTIKLYNLPSYTLHKSFKAHQAPVLCLDVDSSQSLFATGSADSTIRVYDISQGFVTHLFKGHSGIVSTVKFHPKKLMLISGSDDTKIRIWDLMTKNCTAVLDAHVSVIRDIAFSPDGNWMHSGARDQVFCTWDISNPDQVVLERTIPAYESIESLVRVGGDHQNNYFLVTGGQKGILRIWHPKTGECLGSIGGNEHGSQQKHEISHVSYDPNSSKLMAVTSDQNILFYQVAFNDNDENELPLSFVLEKQIAGYNEQILDLAMVKGDPRRLAVITNTEQIRLYNTKTKDCQIVYGHSDIILSASSSFDGSLLMTGSKDASAKLWKVNEHASSATRDRIPPLSLILVCQGHTEAVSTVVLPNRSNAFAITGSQDRTVKVWNIETNNPTHAEEAPRAQAKYTIHAHEKEIQSIAIAPNDKVFATSSLDKTAKLYSVETGDLLGTLKGHKRGIWKVAFSPVDQVLATCSTDKTIKLWNLRDFSCIKTFEGHLNSVLSVSFVTAGLQLLSAGSDGLIKLWNIKENECVATFDGHQDRIWAMTMDNSQEDILYTGSADSTICIWKDVTQEEATERQQEQDQRLLKEQDLSLHLARKDYCNAIALALELNQPFRLLNIFKSLKSDHGEQDSDESDSFTGSTQVDTYLTTKLDVPHLTRLMTYLRDWNTASKHAHLSQSILSLLLTHIPQSKLFSIPGFRTLLDGFLVYSERHYTHVSESLKQSYFIDYTVMLMNRLE